MLRVLVRLALGCLGASASVAGGCGVFLPDQGGPGEPCLDGTRCKVGLECVLGTCVSACGEGSLRCSGDCVACPGENVLEHECAGDRCMASLCTVQEYHPCSDGCCPWVIDHVRCGEVYSWPAMALDGDGRPHVCYGSQGIIHHGRWNTSGWEFDQVGSGHDCTIAVDGSGSPHMAFHDTTGLDLVYATRAPGGWDVQVVDSDGDAGSYPSIALDADDRPAVAYRGNGALKVARWTGDDWQLDQADSDGNVGEYTSLAIDASGNAHVSYVWNEDPATNRYRLRYARWTGATWASETVGDDLLGGQTSLALDGDGVPRIAFDDNRDEKIRYARRAGDGWEFQTVDSLGANERGFSFASLAVDQLGVPHLSYSKRIYADSTEISHLMYARLADDLWVIQTIEDRTEYGSQVSHIAIDPFGAPLILYEMLQAGCLELAR